MLLSQTISKGKGCLDRLAMSATSTGEGRLISHVCHRHQNEQKDTPTYWGIRVQSTLHFTDEKPEFCGVPDSLSLVLFMVSAHRVNCLHQGPILRDGSTIHKWTGQSPSHACSQGQIPSTDYL